MEKKFLMKIRYLTSFQQLIYALLQPQQLLLFDVVFEFDEYDYVHDVEVVLNKLLKNFLVLI